MDDVEVAAGSRGMTVEAACKGGDTLHSERLIPLTVTSAISG